ncbi:unnamed protein product, partial [Nippostrongylus brasiliensis]|uniref:DUF1758 domain-containing protein n=1 Tax=Nippostrongylus brasiliensis TaxID=27835 RepID=A0A0N4XSG8_NIPBR
MISLNNSNFKHKVNKNITMYTFASETPTSILSFTHNIGIQCVDSTKAYLQVQAIPILTRKMNYAVFDDQDLDYPICMKESTPKVLIGLDYFWNLVYGDQFDVSTLSNKSNQYRIITTRLGKVVTDNSFRYTRQNDNAIINYPSSLANPEKHSELEKLVERFWATVSMGIVDNPYDPKEDQCLQEFNRTITYNKEEQRYYVKLPFKTYPVNIPTNRELAFSRLVSNVKMLRRNPTYMEKYHAIFQDQLQRKIIEEIDENTNRNAIHYLAHH